MTNNINIIETTKDHIPYIKQLWADADVMKFVGFPNGLIKTDEQMDAWYKWIDSSRPAINHYSVFEGDVFCGISYFNIDYKHDKSASLDIKLFAFARGRGIATKALYHAIEKAFENGANRVWVDPNPQNTKAIALYNRLGFKAKPMPDYIAATELDGSFEWIPVYMELDRTDWEGLNNK